MASLNIRILFTAVLFGLGGVAEAELDPMLKFLATPIYKTNQDIPDSRVSTSALAYLKAVAVFMKSYRPTAQTKPHFDYILSNLNDAKIAIDRINSLSDTKPDNWDTFTSLKSVIGELKSEKKEQGLIADLNDINDFANSARTLYSRYKAEKETWQLNDRLNELAENIRDACTHRPTNFGLEERVPNYIVQGAGPIFGVGIADDSDRIDVVYPGTEAANAGLLEGDRIQSVAGEPVGNKGALPLIRERVGTDSSFFVSILRGGAPSEIQLTPVPKSPELFSLDLDGNWNDVFKKDLLHFRNISSIPMTDCIFKVTLYNADKSRISSFIHTLDSWQPGESLTSPYYRKGLFNFAESFGYTKYVVVDYKCKELNGTIRKVYIYADEELNKDIQRYCENLKMGVRKLNWKQGFFGNNEAGLAIYIEGIQMLPACKITLKARNGGNPFSYVMEYQKPWFPDDTYFNRREIRDPVFTVSKVDSLDVTLEFPDVPGYSPSFSFVF